MAINEEEKIREAVRDRYGQIARTRGAETVETKDDADCGCGCSTTDLVSIQSIAPSPDAGQAESCCGPSDLTDAQVNLLELKGYSKDDLDLVPDGADMNLGCGNPVALATLKEGETVVDLGSGGGFDCFLAAREVGESGRVIGVDMTSDMISKARSNAGKFEFGNVEFRLGEIEHLPIADNSVDIIMSNCVINLSPDKRAVYGDAFRVLNGGGRLAISDILATAPLPDHIREDLSLWGACVGGAATMDDTVQMLEDAGFENITITPKDESREIFTVWDPEKSQKAFDYVASAYVEAIKPA